MKVTFHDLTPEQADAIQHTIDNLRKCHDSNIGYARWFAPHGRTSTDNISIRIRTKDAIAALNAIHLSKS